MNTQRQPKGIPTGGQFAASAHDEAAPMRQELSAAEQRALDEVPDYEGWTRMPDGMRRDHPFAGETIEFKPTETEDKVFWLAYRDGEEQHGGYLSFARDDEYESFRVAVFNVLGETPKPIVPTPKDPTLEPRIMEAPEYEGDIVPKNAAGDRQGEHGINRSDHWGDFRVGTGYWGSFRGSDAERQNPPAWSSHQSDFASAAIIWQHREDIDWALQGHMTSKRRLRIEVEEDRFVISEYDHSDFTGIVVPRRDV